jgi:Flagellar transcriptional activator (FlhD)
VQRVLREDRTGAMAEFCFSAPLAQVLADLSHKHTLRLAARGQLICAFRMDAHAMLGAFAARAAELHGARKMAAQAARQVI